MDEIFRHFDCTKRSGICSNLLFQNRHDAPIEGDATDVVHVYCFSPTDESIVYPGVLR